MRLVSCHLGNGSSLCAVDHGRSMDTSMGFTPAEGLIMGTRCGDVDAGVLAFLERTEKMSATDSEQMLNKKSGLLGLSGAQINAAEPALAGRFTQGWLLPHEGQLDNRQVLAALAAGLAERGVETHWNTAIDDRELPAASITIDCRGLGAKPVWPTLRGIRGEVARVHAPGIGLARPVRLLHPRYPLYIAPKQNDLYVIGATEVEGEDMSPVSVRSALELLSAAFSVHPGFGEARILELNSQCRPTLPDHRPAIVWDGAQTLRVNGLYRHGYMIAPEVADEAVRFALALADGAIADVDAFAGWRSQAHWNELLHVDHPKSRDAVRESA